MIKLGPKTNHKNISSKLFLEIHLSIYRCTISALKWYILMSTTSMVSSSLMSLPSTGLSTSNSHDLNVVTNVEIIKKDCDVNHHHHSISHPSLRKFQLKWYILMSANSLVVSSLLSLLSTVSSTTTSYVLHIVRHVESIKNFMSAPITTAYDILVEENSTEVIHSICQLPPWSSPPGCPCRPGCH